MVHRLNSLPLGSYRPILSSNSRRLRAATTLKSRARGTATLGRNHSLVYGLDVCEQVVGSWRNSCTGEPDIINLPLLPTTLGNGGPLLATVNFSLDVRGVSQIQQTFN